MGQVIPHVTKDKTPKWLCYPTRYLQIVSYFDGLSDNDIYLYLGFIGTDTLRVKDTYSLVTLSYYPQSKAASWHSFSSSASPCDVLLSVNVSALPRSVAHELKLNQQNWSHLLSTLLRPLASDLWLNQWSGSLRLVVEPRVIEVTLRHWNGLREMPIVRTMVPVEREKS